MLNRISNVEPQSVKIVSNEVQIIRGKAKTQYILEVSVREESQENTIKLAKTYTDFQRLYRVLAQTFYDD